jgi:two-component system chemotaxis sensor kinase CheA
MRLTKLDDSYNFKTDDTQNNSVIVFNEGEKVLGLVVEQIIDIVSEKVDIEMTSDGSVYLGSMVIDGHTTDIVDVAYLFKDMFSDWGKYNPSEAPSANNGRILVVEDSLFFRKMIAPALASRGYDVKTAGNGLEAVNLLQKDSNFQLIITDIDMPEMNGLEFAEACKGDASLQHIPIVALTATSKEGVRSKTVQLGFHDYISKSDRDGLFDLVEKVFESSTIGAGV